jgi:hypothetical protein
MHLLLLQSCAEVPVVEIAAADTEVGSEAEPAQIWCKQPSAHWIDLAPDVSQIADGTAKSKNVGSGSNRAAHGKVQWSPNEVQGKLDAVESCTLLGERDSLRVDGSGTSSPSTVGSVAHGSVQCSPYRSEDVARWMQRGLLERPVLPLSITRWEELANGHGMSVDSPTADGEANCGAAGYRKKYRCSWVGEEELGESQRGDEGCHYGGCF